MMAAFLECRVQSNKVLTGEICVEKALHCHPKKEYASPARLVRVTNKTVAILVVNFTSREIELKKGEQITFTSEVEVDQAPVGVPTASVISIDANKTNKSTDKHESLKSPLKIEDVRFGTKTTH